MHSYGIYGAGDPLRLRGSISGATSGAYIGAASTSISRLRSIV